MQFCTRQGRDGELDRAFASLSPFEEKDGQSRPTDPTQRLETDDSTIDDNTSQDTATTRELSTILFSMRKLREALLASSRTDTFAQRAYVFITRSALLCSSYESYAPALLHLLNRIHPLNPLPSPELHEFVGYYILDLACRLGEFGKAYQMRSQCRYRDEKVEGIVKALVHDDWVAFWRLRGLVDGYQRGVIRWAEDEMRRHALKCIGRSYLSVNKGYVERCAARGWGLLKEKNGVGWELEEGGERVVVRKVKGRR